MYWENKLVNVVTTEACDNVRRFIQLMSSTISAFLARPSWAIGPTVCSLIGTRLSVQRNWCESERIGGVAEVITINEGENWYTQSLEAPCLAGSVCGRRDDDEVMKWTRWRAIDATAVFIHTSSSAHWRIISAAYRCTCIWIAHHSINADCMRTLTSVTAVKLSYTSARLLSRILIIRVGTWLPKTFSKNFMHCSILSPGRN